jgi:hypothetical protein
LFRDYLDGNVTEIKFLALSMSLVLHGSFLAVCSFAFPLQSWKAASVLARPIFLELSAALVLEQGKQVQESRSPDLLKAEAAAKALSYKKKQTAPVPAIKDTKLEEMQKQIDRKINTIRQELHRAVQNQSRSVPVPAAQGFRVVSGGKSGPQWDLYLNRLRQKVLQYWYSGLVEAEGKLVKSEVRIDFTLSKTGKVIAGSVADWKGSEKFRDLSFESFKRAQPFDPVPSEGVDGKGEEAFSVSLFFYYQ